MADKQPKNLYFLFIVEMWERFAFYIMTGLLVLYLTRIFLFSDSRSYVLFGIFSSLLWLTPSVGGVVADRWFGFRRAIILGGIFLAVGYSLLACRAHYLFYLGLGMILIGNGFFKANIPSLLGSLYDGPRDARRDGGFTIYYMGINIGALIGPLVAGVVVAKINWHAGFVVAAIGMVLGLAFFILGQGCLGDRGLAPSGKRGSMLLNSIIVYAAAIVSAVVGAVLLFHITLSTLLMFVCGGAILIFYLYTAMQQSKADRNRMLGCLALVTFAIAFWVLYQQAPMSLTLFTERNVDRHLMGIGIPTVDYQSLNPFWIFVLTPAMNWFWQKIKGTRFEMPTAMKFTIAITLMALGFLLVAYPALLTKTGENISSWWVVWSYGLQSLGELMLSPIGLSMMTAMAPKNKTGMMIGMWFLSSAVSNALAGYVAKFASIPKDLHNPLIASHIYGHAFVLYGVAALIVGGVALLCVPMLSKMMRFN